MKDRRVLISTSSFGVYSNQPIDALKRKGLKVELNSTGRKMTESEIKEALIGVDYLIAGTESLTEDVLKSSKNLKVISRCGVGMDNIDLSVASNMNIKICNTPFGPTLAVAEVTVGLILNLLRKINFMDRNLRNGLWQKHMGNLLFGKQIGIIGFGRIGQKVAELLLPFGVTIRYCDVNDISTEIPSERCDLETLLSLSDIISIHTSYSEKAIIGKDELNLMSPNTWLINMSRGGIVDESGLLTALKEGNLAGAALDVFENEPYEGEFSQLDNVIITPHIGSYAEEARQQMELDAVNNLLELIN